ncbi:MAG: hypothetical protein IJ848_01540 [Alphaproteobacteria bacterium]|nr:hypothetical protein [Alphaproteobacteria bacterium]
MNFYKILTLTALYVLINNSCYTSQSHSNFVPKDKFFNMTNKLDIANNVSQNKVFNTSKRINNTNKEFKRTPKKQINIFNNNLQPQNLTDNNTLFSLKNYCNYLNTQMVIFQSDKDNFYNHINNQTAKLNTHFTEFNNKINDCNEKQINCVYKLNKYDSTITTLTEGIAYSKSNIDAILMHYQEQNRIISDLTNKMNTQDSILNKLSQQYNELLQKYNDQELKIKTLSEKIEAQNITIKEISERQNSENNVYYDNNYSYSINKIEKYNYHRYRYKKYH